MAARQEDFPPGEQPVMLGLAAILLNLSREQRKTGAVFLRRQHWLSVLFLALAVVAFSSRAFGYSFNGYRWTDGTQIVLHLALNRPEIPLQDGSPSWNASAADAIAIWNPYVPKVLLVAGDAAGLAAQDGVNTVTFANDIYGDAFGTATLAVTTYWHTGSSFNETDVIFNNRRTWNSYRGPIQGSGATATYDLHRVALHEFGHVLGLDHPDQHGQNVLAIMNSIISDLDQLADDDIAGGRALYGFKITSAQYQQFSTSGQQFNYQVTADNSPTSFSATGLPPELQIDPATGRIAGRCYTTGTFQVSIVATGARGSASGAFSLLVQPQSLASTTSPPAVLIGGTFSYQIRASNNPTSYSATGLPAGLSLDPATGIISGTPANIGSYSVTVTATGANSIAGGIVRIQVSGPSINSATSVPSIELQQTFTFQVTCTHPASSFSAVGLPPNFQIDPNTGLITGTATQAGSYSVSLKAQTAYGEATGYLYIIINSPHLTSATSVNTQVGSNFVYQITATNSPSSFTSGTLPAGLHLNGSTGQLTGVPEITGSYSMQLTARGALGDAKGFVTLYVFSAPSYTPPLQTQSFPVSSSPLPLLDPVRPRIYAIIGGSSLQVIDSESLAVIRTYNFDTTIGGVTIAPDGSMLYLTLPYVHIIAPLDPVTFIAPPYLHTGIVTPGAIELGGDGYFYVSDLSVPGFVHRMDPQTGAEVSQFAPLPRTSYGRITFKVSPDRNTLFVGEIGVTAPSLAKYALSTAAAPALVQRLDTTGGYASSLSLSPDGKLLAFTAQGSGASAPQPTLLRSTADLNVAVARLPVSGYAGEVAFSPDGLFAIQDYRNTNVIDVIRLATGTVAKTVTLPDNAGPLPGGNNILVKPGSSAFFVFANSTPTKLYSYGLSDALTPPKTLLSVSTRLRAQTGDNVPIGGFIIQGSAPKKVGVRAIGPSLRNYGVTGVLPDPLLELHAADGSLVTANDNWNSNRLEILNANLAPTDDHDAAIVATLDPGAYTAILRGVNNTSGVALVQVYDLSPDSASRVSSLSTRGRVETGDNVMIGGFAVGGDQATAVIVRAIGPSLAQYNVPDLLVDPTLDLYDGNGTRIANNDDWSSDTQQQQIVDSGHAPGDSREAALYRVLPPGGYTAIVRGKNDSAGVALVEIYNLEPAK
ncbi:MAG: putative Ig domain-containing protein [Verrucomicrobiota bacterium]|nr:putative Ig domain-containing protein [Verrucomicrobiota bacterium]